MASMRAQRILGGVAGLLLAFTPSIVLTVARVDAIPKAHLSIARAVLVPLGLATVASPHGVAMRSQWGHFSFDWGQVLSGVPALIAIALLAPMVGYRRRDALMSLVPFLNVWIVWVIASRAAVHGAWVQNHQRTPDRQRTPASDDRRAIRRAADGLTATGSTGFAGRDVERSTPR